MSEKASKFSAALKPKLEPVPSVSDEQASASVRPSRRNVKHIGGYFDPAVSKQLNRLALDEDTTAQALIGEALDMLFQARKLPMIATRKES